MRCPFCNSYNIDMDVIEIGADPWVGCVQNEPAQCLNCGVKQNYDTAEWEVFVN